MKINKKRGKSLVCKTCQTPTHKKCLGIHDINSETEINWEYQTCASDKFPFTLVENKMIVQNTFNSSFSCKCQTCRYELGRPEFVLNTELMISIIK